jgi:hypothetical protein
MGGFFKHQNIGVCYSKFDLITKFDFLTVVSDTAFWDTMSCVFTRKSQVTNGSKTAAIDVIGFYCISVGSSTFQLHDSLRNTSACLKAGFSSQKW